jgi:hypothetical protein
MKKWKGFFYGVAYGLGTRGIFALEPSSGLMTMSFMFIVPFVMGIITAYHYRKVKSTWGIITLVMPIYTILGMIISLVLFGYEGLICAIMAVPIFAFWAMLGGFIGVRVFRRQNNDKVLISFFAILPFLVAPIENQLGLTEKIFTEETSIEINANVQTVWQNITRVKEITEKENSNSLFQLMGFPRPIKAELDTIAVGGVRKAIFDRGLFFTETVTEVVPEKILAFNIEADPNSIPPTALDEHVMVGGKYFDVLEGRYRIENTGNNKLILHLTSKFRLSTRFNFYSGLWSRIIMRDIQKNILRIVKTRSELVNSI